MEVAIILMLWGLVAGAGGTFLFVHIRARRHRGVFFIPAEKVIEADGVLGRTSGAASPHMCDHCLRPSTDFEHRRSGFYCLECVDTGRVVNG